MRRSGSEIAVTGMAGRFPGADGVEGLWQNLRRGVESITFFRREELIAAGVPEELARRADYVPAKGVVEGADLCDGAFFGISQRLAEVMDPQQRLFLEAASQALEAAGHTPDLFDGAIGVYAGCGANGYFLHNVAPSYRRLGLGELQTTVVNDKDYLATQTSFRLGLRGPSVTVQSACSTSLVAVHMASQSLLAGECDMALAGGVSVRFPVLSGYLYEPDGILSPDGHCRPFDAAAAGTVTSSGVGVVVLRRLQDAIDDGDPIRAVILGSAVNNDGSLKAGFTAPSPDGQTRVVAEAIGVADVPPASIGYVEAHGTGTALGDPVEVAALRRAFEGSGARPGSVALGSIKGNVGHLDAAAGVAGLIKAVLVLEHGEIPPTLHFRRANPALEFERGPFVVAGGLRPWPRNDGPRRAGVSSFGLGGTNAHAVLEQAPARPSAEPAARRRQLFVLSARSPEALQAASERLAAHAVGAPEGEGVEAADVAFTLQAGRRGFLHRRVAVASTVPDGAGRLAAPDGALAGRALSPARPVTLLFPGQGGLRVGTGRALYESEPAFRRELDRCSEELEPHIGVDLRGLLFPAPDEAETAARELDRTEIAQPALFAVEYGAAQAWRSLGVVATAVAGHSLGEFAAACVAGVFRPPDALALVATRGRLMAALPSGAMLAVALPAEELEPLLPAGVSLAAVNAPGRCVVAASSDRMAAFEADLAARGVASRRLPAARAYHSDAVEPVAAALEEAVRGVTRRSPTIPWISSVTGSPVGADEAADSGYWVAQLRRPVRFDAAVAHLLEEDRVFAEAGPGGDLGAFVRQAAGRRGADRPPPAAVSLLPAGRPGEDDASPGLTALGRLWIAGGAVDWRAHHEGARRRRVRLPTYPFERRRAWLEPPARPTAERAGDWVTPTPAPVEAPTRAAAASAGERPAEAVLDGLRLMVGELVGLAPDRVDVHVPFLDVGVDSLLLIQASQTIDRRFGVKFSLAELLEEYDTVAKVAAHLDRVAPRERPAPAPVPATATAVPATPSAPGATFAAPAHPFAPASPAAGRDRLSAVQHRHLEVLAARYTARTPESKRRTQLHRARLAENRASVGFRSAWKEMLYPIVAERSAGSRFRDVDGNEYVDLAMGFGVDLFGHSPDFVTRAIAEQLSRGVQIGPQSDLAGEVAELIHDLTGVDRVAFTNSGTEAVMAALRIVRAVTGRHRIVIFDGSYHGSSDATLGRRIGSGARTVPLAPGVPPAAVSDLTVLEYGRPESLAAIRALGGELAAVLVEPVQSRRPDLQPVEFLRELRRITEECGAALVFDEVITGFRSHPAGVQGLFGLSADVTTYGKVLGGGMPIGVVAGRSRFLDALDGGMWRFGDDSAPTVDKTFFAGTFCKHPLAMAAARAVLERLRQAGPALQEELGRRTAELTAELQRELDAREGSFRMARFGSLFRFEPVHDPEHADLFYLHLAERGIFTWEGRTCFLSTAHDGDDHERVVAAVRGAVVELQEAGFLRPPARTARPLPAVEEAPAVPLTPSQRGICLRLRLDPDAASAFNESVVGRFRGPIRLPDLHAAFRTIVGRHEALRATVDPVRGEQRIHPAMAVSMPVVDLSSLPSERRPGAQEAWLSAASRAPFDLARGPLLRPQVARLGPGDHVLDLTVHHLVTDGWSMGILFNELRQIYAARCEGGVVRLPEPAAIRVYVSERGARLDDSGAPAAEYWRRRFEGGLPRLELPGDRPRPRVRSFRGRRTGRRLAGGLGAAFDRRVARERATPFMGHLALFTVLAHQLSDQTDLVVAVALAEQPGLASDYLMGCCLNVVPLRVRVDRDVRFGEHLSAVRRIVAGAQENQGCDFERLARDLEPRRRPDRTPLYDVAFHFERTDRWSLGNLDVEVVARPNPAARQDVSWMVQADGEDLAAHCVYSTDLYDRGRVERWITGYEALLTSAVESPGATLGALADAVAAAWGEERELEQERRRTGNLARLRTVRRRSGGAGGPPLDEARGERQDREESA